MDRIESNVPAHILSTSPVFNPGNGNGLLSLPLNLVSTIVSLLDDDVADLARVVRTCRLLHYMTLPVLYSNVSLYAYPNIRYAEGRPRGHGSASPFFCGLNTLVTRNMGSLVRHFSLSGEIKEYDLEEYARAGRVPDQSFMMNTLVRVAIDKMQNLQSFSWRLNGRVGRSVYEGLAARSTIKSLEINFSTSRVPSPSLTVPAMPNLEVLKFTNLDPICFNDDVSLVILHATKLQHLIMAWSPRISQELDSSVDLHTYFGRLVQKQVKLKVRSFSIKNLYARYTIDPQTVFDFTVVDSITSLKRLTRGGTDLSMIFLEDSWRSHIVEPMPNIKFVRQDETSRYFLPAFKRMKNVEKMYFVNQVSAKTPNGSAETTPHTNGDGQLTPVSSYSPEETSGPTKSEYLETIVKNNGPSLRHLLLSNRWTLSANEVEEITGACPNIEQFGGRTSPEYGHQIFLILTKLKIVRVLRILNGFEGTATPSNTTPSDGGEEFCETFGMKMLEGSLTNSQCTSLEFMELSGKVYRVKWTNMPATDRRSVVSPPMWKANVKAASWEDVSDIDIFKLDSYDI